MFLGEFLCLGTFGVIWAVRRRKFQGGVEAAAVTLGDGQQPFTWRKVHVFLPPALCDMTATSIMYVTLPLSTVNFLAQYSTRYVGLNMTYASSFQMLRGM